MSGAELLPWGVTAAVAVASVVQAAFGRRRAELVARAAHELRGPLAAAHLALHAAGPEASWARAVDLELRRAGLALDDLELARRGGRPDAVVRSVDVVELLTTQATGWRELARACGRRVLVCGQRGMHVAGDPVRLAQATGNLVANALEHGAGDVDLRVRVAGDRVRIEVADGGPGLPAPLSEVIRRPRAGRGRRGRGLAIAAEIAAGHGGRLITAPAARGCVIALELPLAAAGAAAAPAHRGAT